MDREDLNRRLAHQAEVWRANARRRRIITTPLIPVNAHIMASAISGWRWWWPPLEALMTAADPMVLGRSARVAGSPLRRRHVFAAVNLLLMGREADIAAGTSAPGDRAADIERLLDWGDAFCRAARGDGVALSHDGGAADPLLPWSAVRSLAAATTPVDGDRRRDLGRALAALELFSLLMHIESRAGRDDHGPYALSGGRCMIVREMRDLSRNALPWSDVAAGVPHGTVVAALVLPAGVAVELDDFGNTFTTPERYLDVIEAAAVLAAGPDGLEVLDPVAVDAEVAAARTAQTALYRRLLTMSRTEQVLAGVTMHWRLLEPFARAAGLELDWSPPAAAAALAESLDDDTARELIILTSSGSRPYTPVPATEAAAT